MSISQIKNPVKRKCIVLITLVPVLFMYYIVGMGRGLLGSACDCVEYLQDVWKGVK